MYLSTLVFKYLATLHTAAQHTQHSRNLNWSHKKLSYRTWTMRHAMLINLCYALRGMGVRKVSNS